MQKKKKLSSAFAKNWKSLSWWLAVILWMGFIWFLSSLPDLKSGLEQDFILRKIAHVTEFTVLALLLIKALPKSKAYPRYHFALVFLIVLFYALIDEIHQSYVFGREGALKDVLIDSLGIILGVGVALIYYQYRTYRRLKLTR